MNLRNICKITDGELVVGDIYNDGEYSGRVKSISADEVVIESQNEDGDVVDITIPKVSDAILEPEPTDEEIWSSINDPEFICQVIEEASGGENVVTQYSENEDGTLDINITRPITQEEAQYLNEVGIRVGIEGMNKDGWVTVSTNPIADSSDFEQFIAKILFNKSAECPKTGKWVIEGEALKNNGKEVAKVTKDMTINEAIETVKGAVSKANPIKDSELSVGDDYNDGTYSGKVKEVGSDSIKITSTDENGNDIDIDIPIGDSAVHTIKESHLTDLFETGETVVEFDPEETDPVQIVEQIESELELGAAPGEEIPELDVEILGDNKVKVFIV